jgi:hypothetical protein
MSTNPHTLLVAHDEATAAAYTALSRAKSLRRDLAYGLQREAGQKRIGKFSDGRFDGTVADAIAVLAVHQYNERSLAQYEAAKNAVTAAEDAVSDLDDNYTGWSRFFLVTNVGGHIHRSTSCSTCYFDTQFAWLPALSGLTEAEAVEAHGSILCSVCFPSAPVEWTNGTSKASQEAKAQRAADKAARDAKKLEKALLPSGQPLTFKEGRWTESLQTTVAAQRWLIDSLRSERHYGATDERTDNITLVAEAIAARTSTTVAEVMAKATKTASKN